MRKIALLITIYTLAICSLQSQQEKGIIGYDNWLSNWTEFKPSKVEYGEPTQILSGNITQNTKLLKKERYLLLGKVFVTDSATLTIEPGTIIMGDYKSNGSLIVSKSSKIIAKGTSTDPIIFTSNRTVKKAGDWGGLFILNSGKLNTYGGVSSLNYGLNPSNSDLISYGGNNNNSNSGEIEYIRIEYAGKRVKGFGYYNSLTLAGVGDSTKLKNIMISYSLGNSLNVLGGSVSIEKIVSFRSKKNDFVFSTGSKSKIINSIAIRTPYISNPEGSISLKILASEGKDVSYNTERKTDVIAQNITLINRSKDLKNDISMGLVQEGIFVGKDTNFNIDKSVVSGFNPAVVLDSGIVLNAENLENINFTKTLFNNCNGNLYRKGYTNNDDLESYYGSRAFDNLYSKALDNETFIDLSIKNPDYRLLVNKIIASSAYLEEKNESEDSENSSNN